MSLPHNIFYEQKPGYMVKKLFNHLPEDLKEATRGKMIQDKTEDYVA